MRRCRTETSSPLGARSVRGRRQAGGAIACMLVFGMILSACGDAGEEYAQELLHGLDQGKIVGTKGTMENLGRALSTYAVDHGGYPVGSALQDATTALVPAFLRFAITVDAWNHQFSYHSDGRSYTLTSPGADGMIGSADDVVLVDGLFTKIPPPGSP